MQDRAVINGSVALNIMYEPADMSGTVSYYYSSGERLKKGETVCQVRKGESADQIEEQIAAIDKSILQIQREKTDISAFKDDVKSVDTTDFKEWVGKLDDIKEGDKYEVLSDLKKHINELGTEISKENVSNEMQYLYKVLLNFNK